MTKTEAILAGVLIALASFVARAYGQDDKAYVGFQTCLMCHQDMGAKWREMCFREPGTERERDAFHRGCEVCHGPGSAHAQSGDPSLIVMPDKLSPKEQSALCLQCHSRTVSAGDWSHQDHGAAGLSCITCHNLHQTKPTLRLLRKSEPDLCFDCHASRKGEFSQFSHHPVEEGRIKCSSCHEWYGLRPTGEPDRAVSDFCVRCHKEKAGPFLFEHEPVVEDTDEACLTCHSSHGSANEKLLRLPPRLTCLQCHSDRVNHFSGQECASCHTELHGSNTRGNFLNVRSVVPSRAEVPDPQPATSNYELDYGYTSLDLDGNFRRFFRYYLPPTDRFFLENLSVQETDASVPEETFLTASQLDADDQVVYWKTVGMDTFTQLDLGYNRYKFFREFSDDEPLSQRLQTNINLLFPLRGTRGSVFSEVVDNVSGLPASGIAYASSTSSLAAVLPGRYGGRIGSNFETFRDNSGVLFDRNTDTFFYHPTWQGRGQALGASLELKNSDLEGTPKTDRRTRVGLNYSRDIAPSTSLRVDLCSRSRPEAIAETAFAKRADAAEVSLVHLLRQGRLSGGYRRTDMDRRNRFQSATEPLSFNRWWLKAAIRPYSWLRFRASVDQRTIDQIPTSLDRNSSPIPNLIPDDVVRTLLRLEARLGKWGNAWAERSIRRQELDERNSAFREQADRLGVSAALASGVGLTASLARVDYSSGSLNLSSPFSDYDYFVFSLSHPLKRSGSLSLDYSSWDADGANEAAEKALGLGYHFPLRRGGNASARYQFVKDTEAGPLDFSARLLTLGLGFPF